MDDAGLYTAILQEFVKPGEDSECSCIVNIEGQSSNVLLMTLLLCLRFEGHHGEG